MVSRASGNGNCSEVNQGPEKLGPRVNYRGNASGLASLGMAGPVSQHCSPLKSRWEGEVGPLLPPPLPIPLPLSRPPSPTLRCRLSRSRSHLLGSLPMREGWKLGRLSWSPRSCPQQRAFLLVTPTGSQESSGPGRGAVVSLFANCTQESWSSWF